jgi:hypothetical protein
MAMKRIYRGRYFQITLHGAFINSHVFILLPCLYLGRKVLGKAGTGYLVGFSWLLWEGNIKLFKFSRRWRLMREVSAARRKAEREAANESV